MTARGGQSHGQREDAAAAPTAAHQNKPNEDCSAVAQGGATKTLPTTSFLINTGTVEHHTSQENLRWGARRQHKRNTRVAKRRGSTEVRAGAV